MKYVIINNQKFELIENYKDAFILEEIEDKLTDYFDMYDYIIGDYAYNKLRLKGFCKKENKNLNEINDYENRNDYISNFCAYDARYYILERITDEI